MTMIMKCPKCDKEMKIEIENSLSKLNDGKEYMRTVYNCADCDIFVGVYLPKE